MEQKRKELEDIIVNNKFENIICRALESRPGELAKYIAALANKEGGYILIGTEKDNRTYKMVGIHLAFNIENIMKVAYDKLSVSVSCMHGYLQISDKNLFVIRVEKSKEPVLVDNIFYVLASNDAVIKEPEKIIEPATLFISYTECDAPIVDIIEKEICDRLQDKIKISRYTELKYKASFKEFMDTIQDHDFVLTVVSDTYLRKQPCMYEVGEIIKDRHFKDKLLFVVLSEKERKYYGTDAPEKIGPDVYNGPDAKLEYVGFWKEKHESLKDKMEKIDDYEAIAGITKDLQIIGQIYRKDMGEFLNFLSDENGICFKKLYESGFQELIEWMKGIESNR